jgi:hypothetical protein
MESLGYFEATARGEVDAALVLRLDRARILVVFTPRRRGWSSAVGRCRLVGPGHRVGLRSCRR